MLKEFHEKLELIDSKRYKAYVKEIYTQEERSSIEAIAATSTYFGGHMIMNREHILTIGLI